MGISLKYRKFETVTPADILAEYAEADESYAIQNDQVEGE